MKYIKTFEIKNLLNDIILNLNDLEKVLDTLKIIKNTSKYNL